MTTYPEHEKLYTVHDDAQVIGEFLENMETHGFHMGEFICFESGQEAQYVLTSKNITDLLALHFEIDQKKVDQEKRQMLDEIRLERSDNG